MPHPRVLIVGTVPYNRSFTSRAFDAYFHNWERENLHQVFSNSNIPIKGHCSSLFQITDSRMLKRHFNRNVQTGKIYNYCDCIDTNEEKPNNSHFLISFLYKLGKNKTPVNHLLRKWLWKKKYWNTNIFRKWLDDFKPECVFIAFSDDFFINEIAIYIANRFNIPIMACIGDDYYFNDKTSISPFYHIYRKKYKKIIDEVFSHRCSAIYISNKIRDKYNNYFGIRGQTVYLSSEIKRRDFKPIDIVNPMITYCGNLGLGRYKSLIDVGYALGEINQNFRINVYSNENNNAIIKKIQKCPYLIFNGSIPYHEVLNVFEISDLVLVVEGFAKSDINLTRFSLSTKVADSISSGCNIFAYGPEESGAIEYMKDGNYSMVCTNPIHLTHSLKSLIFNLEIQSYYYNKSQIAMTHNHNLKVSNEISESLFEKLIKNDE